MKLSYKYLLIVLGTFVFTSCEIDSFLTVANPNDLSADSFWSTELEVQQGLVATYGALQLDGLLGAAAAIELPVRSDIGRPNNWNANARALNTMEFNENTAIVKRKWQACYIGIYRANQVLANLDNVEMADEVRTQIEAETRFLRGYYYYLLYRGYNKGSVIIHTDVPKTSEDFYKNPSPATEVFALILGDLEFAEANLPLVYASDDDLGRASWGAAAAMLGKLHINERDYAAAQPYFKQIIESGVYSLTANIGDNFDEAHEFNSESIFEVAFSIEAKAGTAGGAQDGPTGSEATARSRSFAPGGNGWRTVMPSYWVTTLYRTDTMDMNNPINADRTGTANYSIRASVSIAIADDDNSTFYQKPSAEGGQYNNREASYLKKFQNWTWDRELQTSQSGINERVIRLADVMLLYAECLIQTGGSFSEAMTMVNEIRERAGVVLLKEGDHDANSLMEHIMWVERPLELMFEGHDIRWEDLTRWGKVKEQFDRLSTRQYVQVDKVLYEFDPVEHAGMDPLPDDNVEAAQFYNSDLHDYFPIPSTELNSNPGIVK
ncbi:MAG: RagB/SusD family nutrient uptake outer membrane protein [Bacteroidota bacterium]